jgi:1-deoxy-D-xylulose-5-phosphate synthase
MRIIPIGRAEVLREGSDVALVGIGQTVAACLVAADELARDSIDATVVNARFAKPLDEALFLQLARGTGGIVTAEENVRSGGFGEAVLALLQEQGLADRMLGLRAMPDEIVDHGPQTTMRNIFGLDGPGLAAFVRTKLGSNGEAPPRAERPVAIAGN